MSSQNKVLIRKTILVTGGIRLMGSNFVKYLYKHHPSDKITVLGNLTYAGNPDNV